ncbi:MAG TPA: acyl-CoA desaturase [Arenimonas sp.]
MPTDELPLCLGAHRVKTSNETTAAVRSVSQGRVRWEPVRSLWFTGMVLGAVVGGALTFSWAAFAVFVAATVLVLLLGHSLGMHRKLVHDSFDCPRWLEYLLVWLGTQVGLAGPLSMVRTHDLRDFAQRLPDCHDFLAHRRAMLADAWWQLHCELRLDHPPRIELESRIGDDAFFRFLERTWMWHHLAVALLFFAAGGWGFVFWGVCARVTAGVFGHWLVGYFAHNHGRIHHEVVGAAVQGHNLPMLSLLTMGECWHNNHHAFPGSSRLGIHPGEWDPGWWTLCGLRRLGLVSNLRLPGDLPFRPELRRLTANNLPPPRVLITE